MSDRLDYLVKVYGSHKLPKYQYTPKPPTKRIMEGIKGIGEVDVPMAMPIPARPLPDFPENRGNYKQRANGNANPRKTYNDRRDKKYEFNHEGNYKQAGIYQIKCRRLKYLQDKYRETRNKKTLAEIYNIDKELKKIDESVGRSTGGGGNYKACIRDNKRNTGNYKHSLAQLVKSFICKCLLLLNIITR